jgi:hypothetical protein
MKTAQAILTAALAVSLAGCVLKGKPKAAIPPAPQPVAAPAPAPPPQPLSLPQTQVQLPPEQPIDPEALTQAQAEAPAEAPPPRRPPRPKPSPASPAPPAESAAPPVPPQEAERGPVRELLDPAESNRLKNNADTHKRSIRAWLTGSRGRRLDSNNPTVARLQLMLKASDDAEEKGDMREASDWADRALILLRELQSGR